MDITRRIACLVAVAALGAAASAHALEDECFKNHFILSEPCDLEWTAVNKGLSDLDVRVVAIDPVDRATVYAGGTSGVFKSVDAGASWRATLALRTLTAADYPGPNGPPPSFRARSMVTNLAVDLANPRVVYASTISRDGCMFTQRRLYKSADAGATWTDTVSPDINGCDNVHALAMDPADPSTLYITNFDDSMGDTWSPVVKTRDGGASWDYLGYPVLNVLAVDPLRNALYAGTFDFEPYYTTLPNGVLKSADGGATWAATALVGSGISALAVDAAHGGTLYAAAFHGEGWTGPKLFQGVFRSIDGGATWTAAHGGLSHLLGAQTQVTSLVIDPLHPRTLYLGTSDAGVWRSSDGGTMWGEFSQGLPTLSIRGLALAPGVPNTLYAATPVGVFTIDDIRPRLSMGAARATGR